MTLKGNVIRVLIFLIALIGSAGTTVFGGLQLVQGVELAVIAEDATALEEAELPMLIAARDMQVEAFHLAMGHNNDATRLAATLDKIRSLMRGADMTEASNLIGEIDRERLNPSPALVDAANRFVAFAEKHALERVAKLNADTAWLGKANNILAWLVLGFTSVGLSIALWGAVTLYRRIRDSIAFTQRDIANLKNYAAAARDDIDEIDLILAGEQHRDEFGEIGDSLGAGGFSGQEIGRAHV